MMSSLCPRPIGTKASMALMPVCRGSFTDLRCITPGATDSTGRLFLDFIGPIPSTACPNELTTRPIKSSPTGTSIILPVRVTISPSQMLEKSPRIMMPISFFSRFCAIPKTPSGKLRSSPLITFSNPLARAMPSPT